MRRASVHIAMIASLLVTASCHDLASFSGSPAREGSPSVDDATPSSVDRTPPTVDVRPTADLPAAPSDSTGDTSPDVDGSSPSDTQQPVDSKGGRTDSKVLPIKPDSGLVVGCRRDNECAPQQSCCNNRCTDVTGDPAHCGGCNKPCHQTKPACCSGACYGAPAPC